ncbi:hypothetical protein DICSQDRAFT_175746 [Dichomitus squalens LYAD-421 SS1]|uniref:C2H2-type domain-containing protein n=1 Tax=Dichomitus squalens (strain LYAD-421) TaxID=732165 RepID=R7SHC9_DICSQ|nr:uncharacterized protein DICSQDRAFT_175746 [Dichomitus squalens LYAD-421 SS1]EJF55566.1 hypothetical protein DICSQDRAFT_175746 [Dichomitus squalens LYAD-421 SS1]
MDSGDFYATLLGSHHDFLRSHDPSSFVEGSAPFNFNDAQGSTCTQQFNDDVHTAPSYDLFLDPFGDADWTKIFEHHNPSHPSILMSDAYRPSLEPLAIPQSPLSEATMVGSPLSATTSGFYPRCASLSDAEPPAHTHDHSTSLDHNADVRGLALPSASSWSAASNIFAGCEPLPPPVMGAADAHSLPLPEPEAYVAVTKASPAVTFTFPAAPLTIQGPQCPDAKAVVHIEQTEVKLATARRVAKRDSSDDGSSAGEDLSYEEKPTKRTRKQDTTPRYQCKTCGAVFARTHNLTEHVKAVHFNERNFSCEHPDCGKSFARKHDLKRHFQSKHTNLGSPRRRLFANPEVKKEGSVSSKD